MERGDLKFIDGVPWTHCFTTTGSDILRNRDLLRQFATCDDAGWDLRQARAWCRANGDAAVHTMFCIGEGRIDMFTDDAFDQ